MRSHLLRAALLVACACSSDEPTQNASPVTYPSGPYGLEQGYVIGNLNADRRDTSEFKYISRCLSDVDTRRAKLLASLSPA